MFALNFTEGVNKFHIFTVSDYKIKRLIYFIPHKLLERMADDDEIDILGDFTLNNLAPDNDSNM